MSPEFLTQDDISKFVKNEPEYLTIGDTTYFVVHLNEKGRKLCADGPIFWPPPANTPVTFCQACKNAARKQ